MRITLRTFGGLTVQRDGEDLPSLPAHRLQCALLIHVALERETSREGLVALLWPDRDPERARHSLSQLIYELRQELGAGCVETHGDLVRATDALSSDVTDFQADVEAGALEAAVRRYRGPFLDDVAVHESGPFQEWVETQRAQLARLHHQARRTLVERRLADGELQSALAVSREWAALEPLADEAQHRTIELLCMAGERTEALQRYEAYERALAAHGVEPLEATRQMIARVRAGDDPSSSERSAGSGRAGAPGLGKEADWRAAPEVAAASAGPSAAPVEGGAAGGAGAPARGAPISHGRPGPGKRSFLGELKRRQVFRMAAGYAVVTFVMAQAADILQPALGLPGWTLTLVVVLALLGFLPAVYLAWLFDITPEGVRRTDAPRPGRSGALAVVGVVVLAGAAGVWLSGRGDSAATPGGAPDPARVAVLPFEDHSPPPGLGSLADAFTEQLIQQVGAVEGLTVLPPSAVRRFRDSRAPLDSIARALGAGTLVTGSFIGTDSAVEVRLQLVDPLTTRSLVPFRIRRTRHDPLDLLDELTGEAANFVRIRMGERLELDRRRRETDSPEAWRLVLAAEEARSEARDLAAYGDSAAGEAAHRALMRADSLLVVAARHDPAWSEPTLLRGWLAAHDARLVELTTDPVDPDLYTARASMGLSHADQLLERDSLNPEALELRGTLRYRVGRRRGGSEGERLLDLAERDLTRAVSRDAGRARAWQALSELYQLRGQRAEARLAAEKALRADAFLEQADEVLYRLFNSALYLQDYPDARARCLEGQRRFPHSPEFLMCELILRAFTDALPADLDTAWQLAWRERSLRPPKLLPDWVPRQKLELAGIAARAGLADSARALIRQGRLDAAGQEDVQIRLNYYEAVVRLQLGERAAAVDLLRKLVAAVPSMGPALARDPWVAALREDPTFREVLSDGRR